MEFGVAYYIESMAQTKLGAAKTAAKYYGLTLEKYLEKTETEKACKKCKEWKLRSLFCKDKGSSDGLSKCCFACRRVKIKKCTKGRLSPMKGRKHTEETKEKMKVARVGQTNSHRIGAKHTSESKKKISEKHKLLARRGPLNPNWKGGCEYLSEKEKIRRSQEYKEWRKAVYERDNYTCQKCGDARGGNLQAHHKMGFADYPELRFVVSNGVTYCETCHKEEHKSGAKNRYRMV